MVGMTTQERLDDICKISGLSEDIVRRVMDAEKKSIAKSLRKGERATLIGRAVIRPEVKRRIVTDEAQGPHWETYIKLSASPASSLEAMLKDLDKFEAPVAQSETNEEIIERLRQKQRENEQIRTSQIQALM